MHSSNTANTVLIGEWWNCQPIWYTEIAEFTCRPIFFLFCFFLTALLSCSVLCKYISAQKLTLQPEFMGHLPNSEAISNPSSLKVKEMAWWTVSMVTLDQNANRSYQDADHISVAGLVTFRWMLRIHQIIYYHRTYFPWWKKYVHDF